MRWHMKMARTNEIPRSDQRSRLRRWTVRLFKFVFTAIGVYLAILVIGLLPVNNGFKQPENGIDLYIVSDPFHADIIVPLKSEQADWSKEFENASFKTSFDEVTHIAFGWGDQEFFLATPTWDDLKVSTAAHALLIPTPSCAHVKLLGPNEIKDTARVTITADQYRDLIAFIKQTLKKDNQHRFKQIGNHSHSDDDAFFEAHGHYHLLNTCNSWVGRGLKAAGVRVPLLSPMPSTPMMYIETSETKTESVE